MPTDPATSIEDALLRFMSERDLSREAATVGILQDWLTANGYLQRPIVPGSPDGEIDPEQVQYPGYIQGSGSL